MAVDYTKFDQMIDTKELKKDIEKSRENNGGDLEEVPAGTYEVKITKLELVASKKSGEPMVTIRFEILSGDYKGRLIFMNQIVTQGFQLNIMDNFLRSLDSGVEVYFDTYQQYGNMLLDIHEAISGNLEYELDYGKNKKGYNTFEILDIFDVE